MKSLLLKKKAVLLSTLFISYASYAQGLDRVNTVLEKVKTALTAIAVVAVTIAVLWAGYKVLFGGQTLREVAPILIGGVLIGAASQIASLLVG